MQHITIKNFGPLADVDIDLPDVILLIGAQASGKSTLAKLVFYFRSLRNDLIEILNGDALLDISYTAICTQYTDKFFDFFDSNSSHNQEFHVRFEYTDKTIFILKKTSKFNKTYTIEFSNQKHLATIIDDINFYKKEFLTTKQNTALMNIVELQDLQHQKRIVKVSIIENINTFFGNDHEPLYIPASRSTLAILPDIITASNGFQNTDELFKLFLQRINILRPAFNQSLNELVTSKQARMNGNANQRALDFAKQAIPIIEKNIIKGRYEHSNFTDFIVLNDNNRVKFKFASSGQQEATWITLQLFVSILNADKTFTVIEEPEAHLYPIAQLEMIKIIALLSNVLTGADANQVMITTHSPYILTALNLLLYAHKVGQQQPEKVDKMVAKEFWLDKNRVAAYEVKGGKLENIIDTDLLHADRIDTASDKINAIFDKLLNMDEL